MASLASSPSTDDGGYIVAASTEELPDSGIYDVYLIRTDSSGNEVWSKTYGGPDTDSARSVRQTADGGYILAGGTASFSTTGYSAVYLIKTDADGNEVWSKTFEGDGISGAYSAQETADGGYVAVRGDAFYSSDNDVYLVYYNPEDSRWETAYNSLFDNPSDLALLRQYRDRFLTTTARGRLYKAILYRHSLEALRVFLNNPELMMEARDLIRTNKEAISDALSGEVGVIYNTERIVSFLDAYAKKAPPVLAILASVVRREIVTKHGLGELFFGLRLE